MFKFIANKIAGSQNANLLKPLQAMVAKINAFEPAMQPLSMDGVRAKSDELKTRLHQRIAQLGGGLNADGSVPEDKDRKRLLKNEEEALWEILPEAFALVRETSRRVLGMRHFDVQLIGGMVLHQGKIAEMTTGEGKTLVATLPAYLNALLGRGVHVVTVNDYLARRDRYWMGPLYEALGLTMGVIQHGMGSVERRASYNADITYGTNNEFGFDYLRDNMVISTDECVQRRLSYAIVDEVDSILIDEARTPLIISGPAEESTDLYYKIDRIVPKLQSGADYQVDEKSRSAVLSEEGVQKAEQLLGVENLYESGNVTLVHHINQALRAHTLYRKDVDYMIKDGQVVIVDEFTGRLMPGRRWSDGLHQAVEAKEGVKIERENQTLATITFQNYFRMFDKLAGMTGTALTEASEFHQIYHLDVATVPTNKPLIRINSQDVVYKTEREKLIDVVQEIAEMHALGRPVLVGTISIEKSEKLSQWLRQPGPLLDWCEKQKRALTEQISDEKQKVPPAQWKEQCLTLMKKSSPVTREEIQALIGPLKQFDKKSELIYPLERLERTLVALEQVRRGIPHHVLNARYHEQEAQIIAQAGRYQAVTIATNMAGRGTDIILGGNAEFLAVTEMKKRQDEAGAAAPLEFSEEQKLAILQEKKTQVQSEREKVVAAGGLHVVGTERHESRRIDNQLRGRCGRQGDPGSSRFYISLEDDLMRIFGENRVMEMLKSQIQEGEVIEMGMMTRAIEQAQKRVEGHNFDIRKRLLEYDNVMNRQREVIYKERRAVLEGQPLKDKIGEMMGETVDGILTLHLPQQQDPETWNFKQLWEVVEATFGTQLTEPVRSDFEKLSRDEIRDKLEALAHQAYEARETLFGADPMRKMERWVMLQVIDSKWKDHLYAMDHLREGIGYRVYGQQDPLVEYQHEAYQMFSEMIQAIRTETVELIYRIQPVRSETIQRILTPTQFIHPEAQSAATAIPDPAPGTPPVIDPEDFTSTTKSVFGSAESSQPVHRGEPKVGRNDPCPCGSGKKFKKCHGA